MLQTYWTPSLSQSQQFSMLGHLGRLPLSRSAGGSPKGMGNGMYRHGLYTQAAADLNNRITDLQRASRGLLRRLLP